MKKFALKSVATVVGVGLSGVAAAQVNLDDSKASDSYKYASETTIGTSKDLAGSLSATMKVGVAFNKDTSAYLRLDLSKGTFTSNPTVSCAAAGGGTTTPTTAVVGAANTFTVFALLNSTGGISSADTCTVTVNGVTVTAQDGIDLQGRVFETLTNALNPSSTNALNSKSKTFIAWTPAISVAIAGGDKATAIVSKSYKEFSGGLSATLGNVKVTESGARLVSGTAAVFTDIVASSTTSVAGDFSFVKDKTAVTLGGSAATTLATTKADFGSVLATGTSNLSVTAEGKNAIKAGSYTATVALTAKTGFTITSPAASASGTIVRDGNNLLIPLAQSTSGYISRFTLVNRSSSDAAYTVSVINEDGATATLSGDAAGGTVKANSTKVVDLTGVGSTNAFNGRGALLVTVEAASNTISGTYQITNRSSGAVSNQTMLSVTN